MLKSICVGLTSTGEGGPFFNFLGNFSIFNDISYKIEPSPPRHLANVLGFIKENEFFGFSDAWFSSVQCLTGLFSVTLCISLSLTTDLRFPITSHTTT